MRSLRAESSTNDSTNSPSRCEYRRSCNNRRTRGESVRHPLTSHNPCYVKFDAYVDLLAKGSDMLRVMEPSPRPASRNLRSGFVAMLSAGLAALAALVVFACTLRRTYIYDDQFVVHSDPRISNPHLWGQFWTKPYMPTDKLYRPLVSLSFAIQSWLHGDRPCAFHLVNILLHAAMSAAVAELGR